MLEGDLVLPEPEEGFSQGDLDGLESESILSLEPAHWSWLPPLTNVYTPKAAWMWGRCVDDGGPDLRIEEFSHGEIGTQPEWLEYELSEGGFEGLVQHDIEYGETRVLCWALQNGIAPGQPFLMWIGQPEYVTSHSMDGTEYDTYYYVRLLKVLPKSAAWCERSIEHAVKGIEEFRRYRREQEEAIVRETRMQTAAMFLEICPYWSNGYDDSGPNALRLSIVSDLSKLKGFGHPSTLNSWGRRGLVSGEDPKDGRFETAMKNLIENAKKELPGLSEEFIRNLPRRHA